MPQRRERACSRSPDDARCAVRFLTTRSSTWPMLSVLADRAGMLMSTTVDAGATLAVAGWRRSRVGTLTLVVCFLCLCALPTACGGKTTQPDSSGLLPLAPGRQLLTLGGFWTSFDPAFPACAPAGQPRDGTSVNTVVLLAREGGDWVARSVPTMGSLELRLRGNGTSARGHLVEGTISGMALDMGLMGVIRDVRVSVASSSSGGFATFDGETASPSSSLVVGKVTGAVRFSDSQGQSSTCAAIQWSMQPY